MPAIDDPADLWPQANDLHPVTRIRMEAHAGEVMKLASQALRRSAPAEAADDSLAAYLALQITLASNGLTRGDVVACLSLLLPDAAIAVAAKGRSGDAVLLSPELCRRALESICRNARERLETILAAGGQARVGTAKATH